MRLRSHNARLEVLDAPEEDYITPAVLNQASVGFRVHGDHLYIGDPLAVVYQIVKWVPGKCALKLRKVQDLRHVEPR